MAEIIHTYPGNLKLIELVKLGPVKATVSYGDVRLVFTQAILSIDISRGSYKYGSELQIDVHSRNQPIIEKRAFNKGFSRINIPIELLKGKKLLHKALTKLWLKE